MNKQNIFKTAWSKVKHMKEIGFKGNTSLMFAIALKEVYAVLKGCAVCNNCIECIHRGVCKKEFLLTSNEKCTLKETEKTYYELRTDDDVKCDTFVTLCNNEETAKEYCKILKALGCNYHYHKIDNVLFKGTKYMVRNLKTDYNKVYTVERIDNHEVVYKSVYLMRAKNNFLRFECNILKDKSEVVREKYFSEIGGLKRMYDKMERGVNI